VYNESPRVLGYIFNTTHLSGIITFVKIISEHQKVPYLIIFNFKKCTDKIILRVPSSNDYYIWQACKISRG